MSKLSAIQARIEHLKHRIKYHENQILIAREEILELEDEESRPNDNN